MSQQPKNGAGTISALLTFILVSLVGWKLEAYGPVLEGMRLLITGSAATIAPANDLRLLIRDLFGLVPLTLGASFLCYAVITRRLGVAPHAFASNVLLQSAPVPMFRMAMFVMIWEELFARQLFLGWLNQLPYVKGPIWLYVMLLLGNTIWSLKHLGNYLEPKDRHPLRTVPQFIGGLFFSYAFLRHGLLGAVLVHAASNSVIFAMMKLDTQSSYQIFTNLYRLAIAAVAFALMDRPISEASVLLQSGGAFVIPEWTFSDYTLLGIVATSGLSALAGILMYDQPIISLGEGMSQGKLELPAGYLKPALIHEILIGPIYWGLVGLGIGLLLVLGQIAVMWLLGFLYKDVAMRAIMFALAISFFQQSKSGSAISRTLWTSLPIGIIAMAVLYGVGFWACIGFHALNMVLCSLPGPLKEVFDADDAAFEIRKAEFLARTQAEQVIEPVPAPVDAPTGG